MLLKRHALSLVCAPFLLVFVVLPVRGQSTHSFNSGMNCYGVWRLPDTGQTTSYTATFGEDHDYVPAATQPMYTVYGTSPNRVTVDNVTGLMWLSSHDDAGLWAYYALEDALAQCEGLDYAGYTDWRLPNVRELLSIVDYSAAVAPRINTTAFFGTDSMSYWSSTTVASDTTKAWSVDFSNGNIVRNFKSGALAIRCVRGGLL